MLKIVVVVAAAFLGLAHSRILPKVNCGYESCPKVGGEDVLNVHVVPHSHDDVGWLKTVDQYYFGTKTNIQRAGVQYIIDSVIKALTENPERRFIQVETAFFHRWWMDQSSSKVEEVKRLVRSGQLEFIGGAWSMNDEGAAHYHSIIDQFSLGLTFLNQTFGACGRPKIGWQIDPFGHSREMANIFSELGYDGLFFSRLDWRDKSRRLTTRTPEMIWQASPTRGNVSNLFTSVLYNHYSAPSGYCFDVTCSDDPIIDDPRSKEYNYKQKVEGYARFIKSQASNYPTNNILITMGDDFNYQDANSYFINLDKLIKGFNLFPQSFNGRPIKVFYSTPSCYVKAVNEASLKKKQAFAVKTDDFFPYATDYNAYWSGYFTSRPTSKRLERQGNNLLQVIRQISAQNITYHVNVQGLDLLEEAVGIMQHHDAITGTEKQHVADDYARIVDEAMHNTTSEINLLLSNLLKKGNGYVNLQLQSCILANVSVCAQSLENNFLVAVWNPLGRKVDYRVRLPVDEKNFDVRGPLNESIKYQIVPSISNFSNLGEYHHAKYDLVFVAEQVPAIGMKMFFVNKKQVKEYGYILNEAYGYERLNLGNNKTGFSINNATGLLESVTINGTQMKIQQELMYYIGAKGDNSAFNRRASGAYIFRPAVNKSVPIKFPKVTFKVYKGDLVDEVHQNFSSWVKQIIRVYKNTSHIEFDWLVGPIPVNDGEPKEVISRFTTPINSGKEFYTDSNGREMVKRTRDYRETYNYSNEEPVAGNYYPVTSKISIQDKSFTVSVLNDRAQGGTSLKSGEMELMVHRRLLKDDGFGVGEALNETEFGIGLVARGTHYLTITGKGFSTSEVTKDLGTEKILTPWVFVSDILKKQTVQSLSKQIDFTYSGITKQLPKNIQLLTLQPHKYRNNWLVVRLEHLYAKDEHPNLSKNVTINLRDYIPKYKLVSLLETALGADKPLDESKYLNWILGENLQKANYTHNFDLGKKLGYIRVDTPQQMHNFNITLAPMQIRTFIVQV